MAKLCTSVSWPATPLRASWRRGAASTGRRSSAAVTRATLRNRPAAPDRAVTVMSGMAAPGATGPCPWQMMRLPGTTWQVQPGPEAVTPVRPSGSWSVTSTDPRIEARLLESKPGADDGMLVRVSLTAKPGSSGLVLAPLSVPQVLVGLVLFGSGHTMIYYAALYYGMAVGSGGVEEGGKHEAVIGLGYLGGPLLALTGIWLGTGPLPVLGVVVLGGLWAAARRAVDPRDRRAGHRGLGDRRKTDQVQQQYRNEVSHIQSP